MKKEYIIGIVVVFALVLLALWKRSSSYELPVNSLTLMSLQEFAPMSQKFKTFYISNIVGKLMPALATLLGKLETTRPTIYDELSSQIDSAVKEINSMEPISQPA